MYVNAFWFGFLIAMVVILILTLILAYIKGREEEKYKPTEEEVREALEEITGKKFRVVEKNGYLVDEMIEEEEESDGKDENAK